MSTNVLSRGFAPAPAKTDLWVRNPLMRLRLEKPLVCDLLLEGTSFEIEAPEILEALQWAAKPRRMEQLKRRIEQKLAIDADAAGALIEDLLEHKFIVRQSDYAEKAEAVRHWRDRGWLDALIFHLRSRDLPYTDVRPGENRVQSLAGLATELESQNPRPALWPTRAAGGAAVSLGPAEAFGAQQTLEDVLLRRRSGGKWRGGPITLSLLSSILQRSNAESRALREETARGADSRPETLFYSSSFSALETYVFVFQSDDLAPGVYHYEIDQRRLNPLKFGDFRPSFGEMCIGQHWFARGSAAFVISGVWNTYRFRYRHARAYRNLFINVAQLANKYILAATGHELATYITPAFDDDLAAGLIATDPLAEAPLYAVAVG